MCRGSIPFLLSFLHRRELLPVHDHTCPSSTGGVPKVWKKAFLPIVPQLVGQASKILPHLVSESQNADNKSNRIVCNNKYCGRKDLNRIIHGTVPGEAAMKTAKAV